MSYYDGPYRMRLNRYGLDYQSRIQGQRERNFETYLYKSIYRVDFEWGGEVVPGSLEHYKQDYTQTQGYLLTRIDTKIPAGTVLMIQNKDDTAPWMVWWLEQIEASGYNRYVVLKMTHELVIGDTTQWGYFYGPGTSTVSDTVKSATGRPLYSENNNLHMFITPAATAFKRDTYFEVPQGTITQGYVVEEFDVNSTPGVAYVSVDPVPLRGPQDVELPKIDQTTWVRGGA